MVATSGDQLLGVASTTPRAFDGASYAISASAASTRCTRSAGGPALSTRRSRPLSVAIDGAAMPVPVVNTNGCAGVSGSTTGASAVSRTTKRPTSICVSRSIVASSIGSTNAVRGSGISPVARSTAFDPATYSSGQVRAEVFGLDRRSVDRYVRLRKELRRGSGRGAAHSPDARARAPDSCAPRGPRPSSVSGPMPTFSGKVAGRASRVAMWSSRPPGASSASADATRVAVGPFERAGLELPDHRDAQRLHRVAGALVDDDHPRDERAIAPCRRRRCGPRSGTRRRRRCRRCAARPSRGARTRRGTRCAGSPAATRSGTSSRETWCRATRR